MARRNKLTKFSEVLAFPNVVENYEPSEPVLIYAKDETIDLKGKWKSDFFKNNNPLVLELACGRGEYSLALGRANPNSNYLGVDIKGARIWKGAKAALDEGLNNVKFLRCKIEVILNFFAEHEVDEIWITFPDPFHGKENRRLTAHSFLARYRKLLKPGGIIHLKTDDDILYEFSLESIISFEHTTLLYNNDDIYSTELINPDLEHKTYYETQHLGKGKKIKYVKAQMN
jgi:tRNA (guanine-N7-)-methyltransferase